MVYKVGKMMNKVFWDKVWAPKCGKSGLFSKARVSVRVSFSRCKNVHFRRTRWCPRLGKWWKKCFLTKFGPPKCGRSGLFGKKKKARVIYRVWVWVKARKCPLSPNQMVSKVGRVTKKVFLDKVWTPNWTVSKQRTWKAWVSVRVRVFFLFY